MWAKMVRNAAHVACAALNEVREENSRQRVPPNGTFEVGLQAVGCFCQPGNRVVQPLPAWVRPARCVTVCVTTAATDSPVVVLLASSRLQLLGLDYLVDSNHHPWLLEVNGTPSLAVAHHDPAVEQLIHKAKVCASAPAFAHCMHVAALDCMRQARQAGVQQQYH